MRWTFMVVAAALAGCDAGGDVESADLPVTVGKPYQTRAGARIPVAVQNASGRALPIVTATCALHDQAGALVESVRLTWGPVAVGETVTGEALPYYRQSFEVTCTARA